MISKASILSVLLCCFLGVMPYALGDSYSPSWTHLSLVDEFGNEILVNLVKSEDQIYRIKEFKLTLKGEQYFLCDEINKRLLFPYLNEISIRYETGSMVKSGRVIPFRSRHVEIPIGGYIDSDGEVKEDFDADLYVLFFPEENSAYRVDVISKKDNSLIFSINSNECN